MWTRTWLVSRQSACKASQLNLVSDSLCEITTGSFISATELATEGLDFGIRQTPNLYSVPGNSITMRIQAVPIGSNPPQQAPGLADLGVFFSPLQV